MAQIQESGVGGPRRCPFLVDAIIVKRKASDRFRNLMAGTQKQKPRNAHFARLEQPRTTTTTLSHQSITTVN